MHIERQPFRHAYRHSAGKLERKAQPFDEPVVVLLPTSRLLRTIGRLSSGSIRVFSTLLVILIDIRDKLEPWRREIRAAVSDAALIVQFQHRLFGSINLPNSIARSEGNNGRTE